jgi:hypothetical protein
MPKTPAHSSLPSPWRTPRAKKPPASAANLVPLFEEKGKDRRELISLRTLLTNKKNPSTRDAARLGDVLLPWFEKTIAKPAAQLEGISELWQKHVPANILQRCRLTGFQRGTLSVALDSSTVRAELDVKLRAGLLRTLQTESKGALFRVKTSVEGQISPR